MNLYQKIFATLTLLTSIQAQQVFASNTDTQASENPLCNRETLESLNLGGMSRLYMYSSLAACIVVFQAEHMPRKSHEEILNFFKCEGNNFDTIGGCGLSDERKKENFT